MARRRDRPPQRCCPTRPCRGPAPATLAVPVPALHTRSPHSCKLVLHSGRLTLQTFLGCPSCLCPCFMVSWSQIPSVLWNPARAPSASPCCSPRNGGARTPASPARASVPPSACGPPSQLPGRPRPHVASSLCSGCVRGSWSRTHTLGVHPRVPGTCPPCGDPGLTPHVLRKPSAVLPLGRHQGSVSCGPQPGVPTACQVLAERAASLLWLASPVLVEVARPRPQRRAPGPQSGPATQPAQHARQTDGEGHMRVRTGPGPTLTDGDGHPASKVT